MRTALIPDTVINAVIHITRSSGKSNLRSDHPESISVLSFSPHFLCVTTREAAGTLPGGAGLWSHIFERKSRRLFSFSFLLAWPTHGGHGFCKFSFACCAACLRSRVCLCHCIAAAAQEEQEEREGEEGMWTRRPSSCDMKARITRFHGECELSARVSAE